MNWGFRSEKELSEHNPDIIVDHLLHLRGITNRDSFLNPTPNNFHDPYKLKNTKNASLRL